MVNIIDLLKELCRKIKKISDEKFDVASLQNICDGTKLAIDYGDSADVVGNMLVIGFSTLIALDAGNISNERVADLSISYPHFKDIYGGRINSGVSGGIVSFYINNANFKSETLCFDFDVYASATHQSITSTGSKFAIPAVLDTAKF